MFSVPVLTLFIDLVFLFAKTPIPCYNSLVQHQEYFSPLAQELGALSEKNQLNDNLIAAFTNPVKTHKL